MSKREDQRIAARMLGINRSQICLQSGAKNREKLVHIAGLTPAQVAATLGLAPL